MGRSRKSSLCLSFNWGDKWSPSNSYLYITDTSTLMQLITNDKFRSVEHRVVANLVGPRVYVACFFSGPVPAPKLYGPINFFSRGLDHKLNLDYYRL
ncbi:hypothetical protein Leryth_022573 [Lithospermum erythrorhizon]|nr:hypothetical protein Leryth_022573 [Lithospermum erythrorhizon]